MIEVKHLYKSFDDKEVLHDINLQFDEGKANLIIGQSGSGKTVLVKKHSGIMYTYQGTSNVRWTQLCSNEQARKSHDATRNGHGVPKLCIV